MEFKEAYEQAILGRKIRRRGWRDESVYFVIGNNKDLICYRKEVVNFPFTSDLADTHDWIVSGGSIDDVVSFSDVIIMLKQGKKVRRSSWMIDSFIQISEDRKQIYLKRTCEYPFQPDFECLSSNDWEVIDG